MSQQPSASSGANGHSTVHDIFALSDEQILEIDPQPQDIEVSSTTLSSPPSRPTQSAPGPRHALSAANAGETSAERASPSPVQDSPSTEHGTRGTEHSAPEPPAWLAAQMKDAWNSEEARALWERVQAGESEAAAYREVFAKPEDARAIKELYPGGIAQAQATVERARLLDEIDRAYFAAQAGTPEQARASRAQLAAMMLREDPAAFREMVYEGLRALEAAENPTSASTNTTGIPRLARAFRANQEASVAPRFSAAAVDPQAATQTTVLKPGVAAPSSAVGPQPDAPQPGNTSASEAQLHAYRAFEKSANAELEKTVGGAIDRALDQALPSIDAADRSSSVGGQHPFDARDKAAPLQARLSQAIREDVERALQGDRQLGEQVAQVLSSRRLDETTRAQVVRLINDRALQLVPGAAKRALNEWTHATLAAHRSRTTRSEAANSRREVAAAAPERRDLRPASQGAAQQTAAGRSTHSDSRPAGKARINYGKLSDDQILDL